jgi:actin-related protein 5
LEKLFIDRLESDIKQNRPAGSEFKLYHANDPSLDAWKGARLWSHTAHASSFITKRDYMDNGPGYFKPHTLSNIYNPTPNPSF